MRILMIAPEPFFLPRGTPFSILHRLKALEKLGHKTDLITYHIGENVQIEGLRIYRTLKLPFMKEIRVGPSYQKFVLDFLIFLKSLAMVLRTRYDCIHTHEEASLMGAFLRKLFGIPHVYDMHSSLPEQLINYNFTDCEMVINVVKLFERLAVINSDAITVICKYLGDIVKRVDPDAQVFIIENVPLIPENPEVSRESVMELKVKFGVEEGSLALYTGTFEYNQGIDLLLGSIPFVLKKKPDVKFILVGGNPRQVEKVRQMAGSLDIGEAVILPGWKPLNEMAGFMAMADVLLSPRKIGTNTPLKIYSYMRAGKPIVATDLLTHTQVLDESCAILTGLTPQSFSEGIIRALRDRELAAGLGETAKKIAFEKYSYGAYLEKTKELYSRIRVIK